MGLISVVRLTRDSFFYPSERHPPPAHPWEAGHGPTLDLAHSSYSQADPRLLHGGVLSGLLLRSAGATTGRLGWRAGICRALSKET